MIECPNCNIHNRPTARFCIQCRYKFPVGEVLGTQYLVTRMLKVGGMGAVYEVESHGRRYALKEMRDRFISTKEKQEAVNRFLAEAMTLAKLDHPRIPKVYRHFIESDRYYLVMDFVEGQDLTDVLANSPGGRLSEVQVIEWGQQICEVLTYLHRQLQPIIFRDMKPANLMLTPDQGLMLIDFGIARLFNPAQKSGASLVGTPGYAAPEQYRGVAEPRSDIYGLGATLHHLLTGVDPTDTSQHLFSFAPVRQHNLAISPKLEQVIERALALKLEGRFGTAAEMSQALRQVTAPLPSSQSWLSQIRYYRDRLWVLTKSLAQPHRRWLALAGLSLAAGLIILLAWQGTVNGLDSRLAFVSDREGNPEIYIVDSSGRVNRLTNDSAAEDHPTWSPDKARLAFASNRDGNWNIYQINADGTGLIRLTDDPAQDIEPAWSPDGRFIAFTSNRDGKRDIYLLGPTEITQMTYTPGNAESWQPAWAPDNTLLFTSTRDGKREVYHTTPSGKVERLTYTPGQVESWSPSWAWNGDYTAFVSDRDGQPEIYMLSTAGELLRLSQNPSGTASEKPAIVSSGQSIAFTSDRTGWSEIYMLTPEGVARLTHTPNNARSWSPAW